MKAFVTGSTGLLGSNLVRTLVEEGHSVTALARSREKAERFLQDTGAEIVVGDMEDVAAFAPSLAGCDVVFHTAAYFREYYGPGDHWSTLERINVDATMQLIQAARDHEVERFVHTSSEGVLAHPGPGLVADESAEFSPFAETNLYFKSKVLGEQRIQEWLRSNPGFPVVLILPGWMMGPGDAAPTASGQLVLDFLHRKLPGLMDGGTCMVDARDVARAMIAAAQRGRSGERYLVAGRYHTLRELAATLAEVTGVPAPRLTIPYPVMVLYAWLLQVIARFTGGAPLVSLDGVRTLHEKKRVSSARAEGELGATFRPLADTLADEVAWFRARGLA